MYIGFLSSLLRMEVAPVLSYHLQYDNGTAATTWYDVVGLAPDSLAT